jgi:hypothetical protein
MLRSLRALPTTDFGLVSHCVPRLIDECGSSLSAELELYSEGNIVESLSNYTLTSVRRACSTQTHGEHGLIELSLSTEARWSLHHCTGDIRVPGLRTTTGSMAFILGPICEASECSMRALYHQYQHDCFHSFSGQAWGP